LARLTREGGTVAPRGKAADKADASRAYPAVGSAAAATESTRLRAVSWFSEPPPGFKGAEISQDFRSRGLTHSPEMRQPGRRPLRRGVIEEGSNWDLRQSSRPGRGSACRSNAFGDFEGSSSFPRNFASTLAYSGSAQGGGGQAFIGGSSSSGNNGSSQADNEGSSSSGNNGSSQLDMEGSGSSANNGGGSSQNDNASNEGSQADLEGCGGRSASNEGSQEDVEGAESPASNEDRSAEVETFLDEQRSRGVRTDFG